MVTFFVRKYSEKSIVLNYFRGDIGTYRDVLVIQAELLIGSGQILHLQFLMDLSKNDMYI